MSRRKRAWKFISFLVLVSLITSPITFPYGARVFTPDDDWPPPVLTGLCDWFKNLPGLECDEETGTIRPANPDLVTGIEPQPGGPQSVSPLAEAGIPDPDPHIPQVPGPNQNELTHPGEVVPDSPTVTVAQVVPALPTVAAPNEGVPIPDAEDAQQTEVNSSSGDGPGELQIAPTLPSQNLDYEQTASADVVQMPTLEIPGDGLLPTLDGATLEPPVVAMQPSGTPVSPTSPETALTEESADLPEQTDATTVVEQETVTQEVTPALETTETDGPLTETPPPTTNPTTTQTPMPTATEEVVIAQDQIHGVSSIIDERGGTISDPTGLLELIVKPNAVAGPTQFTIAAATNLDQLPPMPWNYPVALFPSFTIEAIDVASGLEITSFEPEFITTQYPTEFSHPDYGTAVVTYQDVIAPLELHFNVAHVQGNTDPHRNVLFYLDEYTNEWLPMVAPYVPEVGRFVVESDHLTQFSFNSRPEGGSGAAGALVLLDPDHGGANIGGHVDGPPGWEGLEKNFNLDTALRTRALLEACGVEVIMTRSDDTAVSAAQRANMINSVQPDASVTIAYNIVWPFMTTSAFTGSGIETWRRGYNPHADLANRVANAVYNQTSLTLRRHYEVEGDTHPAGIVARLAEPVNPYVHAELAFMDNYHDRSIMNDHPEAFAEALYNALAVDFLGVGGCEPIAPSPWVEVYRRVFGVPWWLPQYYNVIGADPVYLPTGNFVFQARDYAIDSPVPFSVERTYNSLDTFAQGSMGLGWSTNLDSFLYFDVDNTIDWRLPDGQVYTFSPTGSGPYSAEDGVFEELYPPGRGAALGAGADEYVIRQRNEQRWYFRDDGKLVRISDRNDIVGEFTFSSGGSPAQLDIG